MDKTRCGFCSRKLTPQEWEQGLALVLLGKVWCQDCQVKLVAHENLKRGARGKRYSGHRITTVRPPRSGPSA